MECVICNELAGDIAASNFRRFVPDVRIKNRVLFEDDMFVVIPTLGGLVPGHILLFARHHWLSFGAMLAAHSELLRPLQRHIANIRTLLAETYGQPVVVFEHGPSRPGQSMGCSTDHAHLHFVPTDADVEGCLGAEPLLFSRIKSLIDLAAAPPRSYIYFEGRNGGKSMAIVAEDDAPSQYMRRVVARAIDRPTEWNWRDHPHPERLIATLRRLRFESVGC